MIEFINKGSDASLINTIKICEEIADEILGETTLQNNI